MPLTGRIDPTNYGSWPGDKSKIGYWVESTTGLPRSDLLRPKVVGVDVGRDRIAHLPTKFLTSLVRNAIIHYHPADRAERNWHDPDTGRLFVSTLAKGTNTGLFRQHAMRLNSSATCDHVDFTEFTDKCPPSARNPDLSLRTNGATLDICTGPDLEGKPSLFKNPEQDGRFQIKNITEVAYINMTYIESPFHSSSYDSDSLPDTRLIRCTGATTLGYFELGNRYNSGQHGPLVSARSNQSELWTMDGFIRDTRVSNIGGSPYQDWDLISVYQESQHGLYSPYNGFDEWEEQHTSKTPGPLLLTLHALFGEGSVFRLAQDLAPLVFTNSSSLNPEEAFYDTICHTRPFPFRRLDESMAKRCPYYYPDKSISWASWADEKLFQLMRLLGGSDWLDIDFSGNDAKIKYIEMAMHLASQTLMEAATNPGYDNSFSGEEVVQIWSMEADDVLQFKVSDTAMIVVSVLVALQAVGILGLLWYIYRAPTWTSTLDAMAIARIAHQIKDDGLIKGMGLKHPTKEEWAYLAGVDALVGLSKGGESIELSTPMNGARSAAAAPAPVPSPGLLSADRAGHTATPSIRTSPPSERSMAPVSPVSPASPTFPATAPSPEPMQPSQGHLQPEVNPSTASSRRQSFNDADLDVDNNANNADNLPPAYSPRGAPPVVGQAGFPDSAATSQVDILPERNQTHQQSSLPPLIPPPNPFEDVERINRQAEARRRRAAAHSEEISVQVGGEGLIDRQARKRANLGLIRTVQGGDEEQVVSNAG